MKSVKDTAIYKSARDIYRHILKNKSVYNGVILPPRHLRFCGDEFKSDSYYFESSKLEAERLAKNCALTLKSSLLDFGCGSGRLSIGILQSIGEIKCYRGVDVNGACIRWCKKHITREHPNFQFIRTDVKNLRYNPKGKAPDEALRLPFEDGAFNIIYLYSVFSHMDLDDVKLYTKEFHRLLASSGKIFLTAFLEDNVEEVAVNPKDYRMNWSGDLHCVRYGRAFFEELLSKNGYKVDHFVYGKETEGQSALYISKK